MERESGYTKEFASKLEVALPTSQGGTGQADARKKSSSQILYKSKLESARSPRVPDGLVWYPHEDMWKSVAEQRLEAGLDYFDFRVAYTDDFGVNASLEGVVAGSGLSLGGDFENHESTRWRMAGRFRKG